jgi:preprotein translocase subunit SecD
MLNKYPLWKYILFVIILVFGFLYSLPNLFGESPALQVSASSRAPKLQEAKMGLVTNTLRQDKIPFFDPHFAQHKIFLKFPNTDDQARAQEVIQKKLGDKYIVAMNLAPNSPAWLKAINATPMKQGLDLRGGIHFLLSVDVNSIFKSQSQGDVKGIGKKLRENHIRYSGLIPKSKLMTIKFREDSALENALPILNQFFPNYQWKTPGTLRIKGELKQTASQELRQNIMEQSMSILRNRINELGIAEPVVQQQGPAQISVDLPGVQDATAAEAIIGKTATVQFHLVNTKDDITSAINGILPAGSQIQYDNTSRPYLLYNTVVLKGADITNAGAQFGEEGPEVIIRLGNSSAASNFNKITAQHIDDLLASVYVESRPKTILVNGKKVTHYKTERHIINSAVIRSALGSRFSITGLSMEEAQQTALLLRAGALPVPIHIVQERTIGPSLGKHNIEVGLNSILIGFIIIVIFMALYYRFFGILADFALFANLLLIVAVMSLLGATLTLPGIAGILLTLGMAVDANVLIFERIREELHNSASIQASIHAGYERAFTTIVDANVTTLIVALVLFTIGSGAVKGFAVTITIGLITSMITSIFGTRAIVNLVYGGRTVKWISIGMSKKYFANK